MPRNRKRKPPTETIEARMWHAPEWASPSDSAAEWHAHCGRCDQHLMAFGWVIKMMRCGRIPVIEWTPLDVPVKDLHIDVSPARRTLSSNAIGGVWDGEVWRPTAEHRARRHEAWLAEQRGEASPTEKNRLRYDVFHRSNPRSTFELPAPLSRPMRDAAAYLLPTKVECATCGAVNIVDVKEARAALTKERAVG
jgi:hypothetical protein